MSTPTLDHEQLADGFRRLGIRSGGVLFVHSSLGSIGHVKGGAAAVIEALLDVLGPEGTLLMPTHHYRDGRVFDVDRTPSAVGVISETFRRRPGVLRSRHPFHPVAARGAKAAEMLRDHERSPIPDGPHTPYGRLIREDAQVLMLGCDLSTLTLLHTVEEELDLPYLTRQSHSYLDRDGQVRELQLERCPGGARRNVFAFDRLFRAEGAMRVGKVGRAVCRLIDAAKAAGIMRRELTRDPAFVLGHNPHCSDSRQFHGNIKAAREAREDFCLTASLPYRETDRARCLRMIQEEGIRQVEIDLDRGLPGVSELASLRRDVEAAGLVAGSIVVAMDRSSPWRTVGKAAGILGAKRVRLLPPDTSRVDCPEEVADQLSAAVDTLAGFGTDTLLTTSAHTICASLETLRAILQAIRTPRLQVAYDPAAVAMAGQIPFYDGLYRNSHIRSRTRQVQVTDCVADAAGACKPGRGNSEIKEIISNFRCRGFDGLFCLMPVDGLSWRQGFSESAAAFWEIMDGI